MLPIPEACTVTRIKAASPAELYAALARIARIRADGAGQPITIESGRKFLLLPSNRQQAEKCVSSAVSV